MTADALMHAVQIAFGATVSVGIVVSILFSVTACVSARRFSRQRRPPSPTATPAAITVLKPLHGADPYLWDNLQSLCLQDYPSFQIVFGVRDPHDPAVAVVRRLQRTHPGRRIDLVVDGRLCGANCKVSNLHNMLRMARHDVLVIADSDVRVPANYLRRLADALADPAVGVVSCLYRARNTATLPARVESLIIDTDFVPMVFVARVVEPPTYAFGATMALRRAVLDRIGGVLPLANLLADDYHLGCRVAQEGYQLILSDLVVETVCALDSWRQLFDHQLRWARTYRSCRPVGYFFSVLTHGSLWALLALGHSGFTATAWLIVAAVCTSRILAARYVANHVLGATWRALDLVLVPLKDLGMSLLWLLAFVGSEVVWGGRRYRLRTGGRIEAIGGDGRHEALGPATVSEEPDRRAASA